MASSKEGFLVNKRGQRLYTKVWPAVGEEKARFIFEHGYGSHSGAYDSVQQKFAEAGISVYLFDAHSFGKSEPLDPKLRSLVQDPQHLVDDLYQFLEEVVKKDGSKTPLFLGGLSMGGMIAILAAIRDQTKWQGLVLCSPAIDTPRTPMIRFLMMIQGLALLLAPNARLAPQPQLENITNDATERAELLKDPYYDPLKLRIRMAKTFLQGWDHIAKHERSLTLPILITYSPIDKVVFPPATQRFVKNVQSKDVTLRPYDNYFHDLYLQPCKYEAAQVAIDWILEHCKPTAGSALPAARAPAAQATATADPSPKLVSAL